MHITSNTRAERRIFAVMKLGALTTIISPIASLLFVTVGHLGGATSTMHTLCVGSTISFVVGLVTTTTGFSQRACHRQRPVTAELTPG
jgi:hypothetical protein